MPDPKRILVVNLAGLGDIISSSAALKNLQTSYPASEIVLLTFLDNAEALKTCPYIQDVFYFQKKSPWKNWKTIFAIRSRHFDCAVNLYTVYSWWGALKMWALLSLAGADATYGRNTDGKGFFFRHRWPEKFPPSESDSQCMLNVVKMLGVKGQALKPELWIQENTSELKDFLHKHDIQDSVNYACIHPGATRKSHRWAVEYFAEVADALSACGLKIIITGNRQERYLAERLAHQMKSPSVMASAEWTLGGLTAALKQCRLFISNDTGPMHIASALNVPMIVISGNSPLAFLPVNRERTIVLRADKLNSITPLHVMGAAETLLGKPAGALKQKNKIKVLHLHTRAIVGGSGTNALLTLAGLPQHRFEGHLACGVEEAQPSFLDSARAKKIPVFFIPPLVNHIDFRKDILAFIDIIRLIKKERYSIVHTHNSKAGILGRLAAKICGVKIIVHTVHSCVFHYGDLSRLWKKILTAVEKAVAPFTDEFIAISEHIRKEYHKHHIVPKERMRVIYSGIDMQDFKQTVDRNLKRREFGFCESDTMVGMVARMDKGKGHEYLLRAIPEILEKRSDVSFIFVGEGPLRFGLESLAKEALPPEKVIFTGLRSDVADILKTLDVFCLPSEYEGMGRVVLEAQASGVAVVATDCGGIPDIVKKDKTAILVPAKNSHHLSAAILRLVENPRLRADMGQAAQDFVDERFSSQTMVTQIVRLYDELLQGSS